MTNGKKTMSKTNESTSVNLRQVLRFRRGETGPTKDVQALEVHSLEARTEDIVGIQNLPRPLEIVTISNVESHLHRFLYFTLFEVNM